MDKAKTVSGARAALNTTIDSKVLADFKSYCGANGYKMSMVLETFMKQFVQGDFVFKPTIGRKK